MKKFKAVEFYEDFLPRCKYSLDWGIPTLPFCRHPSCLPTAEDPEDATKSIGVCSITECPCGREAESSDYSDSDIDWGELSRDLVDDSSCLIVENEECKLWYC